MTRSGHYREADERWPRPRRGTSSMTAISSASAISPDAARSASDAAAGG
jgi:hypothetical protein